MRILKSVLIAVPVISICALPASGVELVTNGTLEGGFTVVAPHRVPLNWTLYETRGLPTENSLVYDLSLNGPSQPGVWSWEFFRNDFGLQTGDWTTIEQALSIPAMNYLSLTLSVDVQVLSHNLEAGGWVVPAFEWPAVVQIDYTDVTSMPQVWRFGWYLNPPGDFVAGQVNDPGQGLIPIYNDVAVPPNVWVTGTFNLFTELPMVATIDRIRVGGSGWDFHCFFDNISINGVPNPVGVAEASWGGVKALYR
jgi:hypothetical protein